MFENPDFEVDRGAEEYRLLNPVLSRLDKGKEKKVEAEPMQVIKNSPSYINVKFLEMELWILNLKHKIHVNMYYSKIAIIYRAF